MKFRARSLSDWRSHESEILCDLNQLEAATPCEKGNEARCPSKQLRALPQSDSPHVARIVISHKTQIVPAVGPGQLATLRVRLGRILMANPSIEIAESVYEYREAVKEILREQIYEISMPFLSQTMGGLNSFIHVIDRIPMRREHILACSKLEILNRMAKLPCKVDSWEQDLVLELPTGCRLVKPRDMPFPEEHFRKLLNYTTIGKLEMNSSNPIPLFPNDFFYQQFKSKIMVIENTPSRIKAASDAATSTDEHVAAVGVPFLEPRTLPCMVHRFILNDLQRMRLQESNLFLGMTQSQEQIVRFRSVQSLCFPIPLQTSQLRMLRLPELLQLPELLTVRAEQELPNRVPRLPRMPTSQSNFFSESTLAHFAQLEVHTNKCLPSSLFWGFATDLHPILRKTRLDKHPLTQKDATILATELDTLSASFSSSKGDDAGSESSAGRFVTEANQSVPYMILENRENSRIAEKRAIAAELESNDLDDYVHLMGRTKRARLARPSSISESKSFEQIPCSLPLWLLDLWQFVSLEAQISLRGLASRGYIRVNARFMHDFDTEACRTLKKQLKCKIRQSNMSKENEDADATRLVSELWILAETLKCAAYEGLKVATDRLLQLISEDEKLLSLSRDSGISKTFSQLKELIYRLEIGAAEIAGLSTLSEILPHGCGVLIIVKSTSVLPVLENILKSVGRTCIQLSTSSEIGLEHIEQGSIIIAHEDSQVNPSIQGLLSSMNMLGAILYLHGTPSKSGILLQQIEQKSHIVCIIIDDPIVSLLKWDDSRKSANKHCEIYSKLMIVSRRFAISSTLTPFVRSLRAAGYDFIERDLAVADIALNRTTALVFHSAEQLSTSFAIVNDLAALSSAFDLVYLIITGDGVLELEAQALLTLCLSSSTFPCKVVVSWPCPNEELKRRVVNLCRQFDERAPLRISPFVRPAEEFLTRIPYCNVLTAIHLLERCNGSISQIISCTAAQLSELSILPSRANLLSTFLDAHNLKE